MATEKKEKFGSDIELSRDDRTNQKRATKKGCKAVLICEQKFPEKLPSDKPPISAHTIIANAGIKTNDFHHHF